MKRWMTIEESCSICHFWYYTAPDRAPLSAYWCRWPSNIFIVSLFNGYAASSSALVYRNSPESTASSAPNAIQRKASMSARTAALAGKLPNWQLLRFSDGSSLLWWLTPIFVSSHFHRYRTGLTVVRCSCPPNYNGSLCEFRREFIPAKGNLMKSFDSTLPLVEGGSVDTFSITAIWFSGGSMERRISRAVRPLWFPFVPLFCSIHSDYRFAFWAASISSLQTPRMPPPLSLFFLARPAHLSFGDRGSIVPNLRVNTITILAYTI